MSRQTSTCARSASRWRERTPRPSVYGTAVYAGDLTMPGMLYARRPAQPTARAPGSSGYRYGAGQGACLACTACLTAEDLPAGQGVMTDMPGQTGGKTKDTTAADPGDSDRVRFCGEPVALVAAESQAIAEEALGLIDVEYEDMEGVHDPFDALKPGAPIVYGADNVVASYKIRKGDLEKGFAEADLIVENTFTTQYQEQAFLEPEAAIWPGSTSTTVLNIRSSTQVVEHFRAVADAVGLPHNRVRLRAEFVGGGFGGKEVMTIEVWLALLALATRRPVRLVQPREKSFLSHGPRHPFTITHRTGVTRTMERSPRWKSSLTSDAGAYAKLSPYILLYATVGATGPYKVDNLHVDSVAAATNNLPTCAFRGFGTMQANLACEGQIEEIAKVLGIDAMDVRRRNFIRTGEPNVTGQIIRSAVWSDQCATKALEALGERPPHQGPVRIGRGVACLSTELDGRIRWMKDSSEAWVGVEMDGTVIVRSAVIRHRGRAVVGIGPDNRRRCSVCR